MCCNTPAKEQVPLILIATSLIVLILAYIGGLWTVSKTERPAAPHSMNYN